MPSPSTGRHRTNLTGPVLLILIGVLFLFQELVPEWGLRRTWPLILVVLGMLKLWDAFQPPRGPEGPKVWRRSDE